MPSTDRHTSVSVDPLGGIEERTLPPLLAEYADKYEAIIGRRDTYLWKWMYSVWDLIQLSSTTPATVETTQVIKTLIGIYVATADDFAEATNEKPMFEEAAKVPFPNKTPDHNRDDVDTEILTLITQTWDAAIGAFRQAPRFDDLRDVFYYDIAQTVNAMHYSYVMNQMPEVSNSNETRAYAPHNMTMMPATIIDLAYSPGFKLGELGDIRQFVWDAQKLARIGNSVTTWERELREGDFSANIFVHALEEGILTHAELDKARENPSSTFLDEIGVRIREHGIEEKFLSDWDRIYHQLRTQSHDITSFDVDVYLDGMETVLEYHLASRGKK